MEGAVLPMEPANLPSGDVVVKATPQPVKGMLSILLPVRNEGVNLKIMLKILRVVIEIPHEILVVHDFPHDTSVPVVNAIIPDQPQVRLVHNTLGAGVINAIRAGVQESRGEFVLIFAADEVGPVLALQDMLDLMGEGCDFVSCTRYAYGGRRLGGSFIGGLLSRLANKLFHFFAGSVLTDATTGIKMFRRSVFEKFHLESKPVGWAVAFEMGIKAQVLELKLGEVPIISIDRLYGGKSTFRLTRWFKEYFRWFLWGARELRKHPRPKVMVRLPSTSLEVR